MGAYTKLIQCPEHKGECKATLFCEPHKFAGIWECDNTGEGISDTHEHKDYEVETVEVDTMRNGEHDTYEVQIYVCGGVEGCGVEIEGEDPAADRADYLADMQIMEARGK